MHRVYSRFFVQQSESFFRYFEFLREPLLQPFHRLLLGQGELEPRAGGGVDVKIHGGLSRDGLAGRSPAAGAAPSAGVLVHPITCGQRRVETRRAQPGMERGGEREKDPTATVPRSARESKAAFREKKKRFSVDLRQSQ